MFESGSVCADYRSYYIDDTVKTFAFGIVRQENPIKTFQFSFSFIIISN